MPFRTLPALSQSGLEGYTASMPKPLIVAILDSDYEREGRTTAIVAQGFAYDHPGSGAEIVVPEGYITDFASIPTLARAVFPPFGRHAKAAVLHDWLYLIGEPGRRDFADRVFLDAAEELGVGYMRRHAMYQAVRLGGGGAYAKEYKTWSKSFGNWMSGDITSPVLTREACYSTKWPKPPRPDYHP